MTRGVRGATTVTENNAEEILANTKSLMEEMVQANSIQPESVSHVFISVTNDIDATFPAKSLRELEGDRWTYVPVMCMKEIDVPGSLARCIRVMMVINSEKQPHEIHHIFHHNAVQLRPDLLRKPGD